MVCAGDEPLVAIPEPYEAVAKGMSVSDEVAMAGDPAGSQAQSGESGSLPNHVSLPGGPPWTPPGSPVPSAGLPHFSAISTGCSCQGKGLATMGAFAFYNKAVLHLQCCGKSVQQD